jgi:hypothetical protein
VLCGRTLAKETGLLVSLANRVVTVVAIVKWRERGRGKEKETKKKNKNNGSRLKGAVRT